MIFENSNEIISLYELNPGNSDIVLNVRETDMTFIWNVAERMDITVDKFLFNWGKTRSFSSPSFTGSTTLTLNPPEWSGSTSPFTAS